MKKRILLVEDNPTTSKQLCELLAQLFCSFEVEEDGLGGLNRALRERFDLIITDHKMPLMDGLVLARNLRESDLYRNTPIVLLTTDDLNSVEARAEKYGINAVVAKPISISELELVLNDYAEQDIA